MPEAPEPASVSELPKLGKPGEVVRALNFAGGGFDTVMELGVIHALLVSQGRAPDAVVGVSAGAVHATVLAEVLQAGAEYEEEGWSELELDQKKRVHEQRTNARVSRFRGLLDGLERAPEELVDELLPDAYQINSLEPLRPVDSPVFMEPDRNARLLALSSRSGLVRLYNDLLGFGVSFGTITRAIRRVLGLRASAEVSTRFGRVLVRLLECWRLWVLVGANLSHLAPVLSRLTKAYFFRAQRQVTGETAGTLIFRFRPLSGIGSRLLSVAHFVIALFCWGILSMTLFLLPVRVASGWNTTAIWIYAALALIVGAVYAFNSQVRDFERTSSVRGALKTLAHGIATALIPLVSWLTIALIVALIIGRWQQAFDSSSPGRAWELVSHNLVYANWVWVVCGGAIMAIVFLCRTDWQRLVLRYYRIERSLLHPYPLESLLSRLFDPTYYGSRDLGRVVDTALSHEMGASRGNDVPRKSVGQYASNSPPIHLGIALADVHEGKLEVVPPEVSLVDGLVGAMSVLPWFPPKRIGRGLYVDATNLANEPMQALFEILRERMDPEVQIVHVYSVASLPFTRDLEPLNQPLLDLIQAAGEGLLLGRFRDAQLERRLTEGYTEAMPFEATSETSATLKMSEDPEGKRFFRAWVTPIEPDTPILLNRRLFRAPKKDARKLIRETIADGCRAALEAMIVPSLNKEAGHYDCDQAVHDHIMVRAGIAAHVGGAGNTQSKRISAGIKALAKIGMPGKHGCGPGLQEVCEYCVLSRKQDEEEKDKTTPIKAEKKGKEDAPRPEFSEDEKRRVFRTLLNRRLPQEEHCGHWESLGPAWPHEREVEDVVEGDPHNVQAVVKKVPYPPLYAGWPRERRAKDAPPVGRPTISFLFSGGVFRGVFQIGALNALLELGLRPDVVGGASVGSITGAMTATVFAQKDVEHRKREVARLAAAYLALDRLVLTDRFADFIRNITVRAADARFSLRQADRVFRKYDSSSSARFEHDLRTVFAGIERLLYVSPFELARLVEAIRDRRNDRVAKLLGEYTQGWLDRMGAGLEVLGAEPLELLIKEFVTDALTSIGNGTSEAPSTFASLEEKSGTRLLATTTNAMRRQLELLGGTSALGLAREGRGPDEVRLGQGLLASSAFPAVFRPRWSHEVFTTPGPRHQYMDGGMMDNLPLDPVAEFLCGAVKAGAVQPSPSGAPHLMFAASLEPRVRPFREDRATWITLSGRASELSYNGKLKKFAAAQRHLRRIRKKVSRGDGKPDLKLMIVEPEWLCGTFAFHPMLGFRRKKQAASIAHGCASTLLAFAQQKLEYRTAWGVDEDSMPEFGPRGVPKDLPSAVDGRLLQQRASGGTCWMRPGTLCPFSAEALAAIDLPPTTCGELTRIYRACLKPETHKPHQR